MSNLEKGKKFSSEYQPKEKWTEDKSLDLGHNLIEWLKESNDHIFFEEFLIIESDLYPEIINYLSNKFPSFLKLVERAKKIQEIKLVKFGVADLLNATMTKFVLTNHHGYADKSESKSEVNTSITWKETKTYDPN